MTLSKVNGQTFSALSKVNGTLVSALSAINGQTAGGGINPDAQAFLTATGIVDATITTAINDLVNALQAQSLWTKMQAIYPIVGGTANTHKYNLKDPQDTDGSFRLSFNGGWTHSATGALPDGSTAYADTHFIPATNGTVNDGHLSIYSRTNGTTGLDMYALGGGYWGIAANAVVAGAEYLSDAYDSASSNRITTPVANSLGLFVDARTNSTTHKAYQNGSQLGSTDSSTSSGFASVTLSLYLGAANNGAGPALFSNHEYAFASIGTGLSDTDVAHLYTAVQACQVTLSRQV